MVVKLTNINTFLKFLNFTFLKQKNVFIFICEFIWRFSSISSHFTSICSNLSTSSISISSCHPTALLFIKVFFLSLKPKKCHPFINLRDLLFKLAQSNVPKNCKIMVNPQNVFHVLILRDWMIRLAQVSLLIVLGKKKIIKKQKSYSLLWISNYILVCILMVFHNINQSQT